MLKRLVRPPAEGLCANIGEQEMSALKFGDWVLARDEVLVADGHEQRFLYMVVQVRLESIRLMTKGVIRKLPL